MEFAAFLLEKLRHVEIKFKIAWWNSKTENSAQHNFHSYKASLAFISFQLS